MKEFKSIQTVLLHRSPHLTAGEVKYSLHGKWTDSFKALFYSLGNFAWSEIVCLRCFFAEWWLINTML